METNQLRKIQRKFKKGMTLVELAVVVLILGAIITLVALNINPGEIKDQVASVKLKKDSNELLMYLEQYAERHGKMPSEDQGIKALIEKPSSGDVPDNWKPILKNKSAILDPWGTPYVLKFDNNGDVSIVTLGKDKKEGGEGKNSDFNILKQDEYPADFRK